MFASSICSSHICIPIFRHFPICVSQWRHISCAVWLHRNPACLAGSTRGSLSLDSDWGRRLSRQAAVQAETESVASHLHQFAPSRASTPPTPTTPSSLRTMAPSAASATSATATAGAATGARAVSWHRHHVPAQGSVIRCSAIIHRERTPTSPAAEAAAAAAAPERY